MRFSEADFSSPGQLDFVPRERRNQIWHLIFAFAAAILLVFVLGLIAGGADSLAALSSMAVLAMLCLYVIFRQQQGLDLVMATEYQNMLFAQAATLGADFCLFVRQDGTITYADDGLRNVFPNFIYGDSMALEGLFDKGGVRKIDRERIMAAIYAHQSDRLVFPIIVGDTEKDYILTVEPLQRPGGYLVVRGREYRSQRAGVQLLPDVLRSTSADKLDHLLSTTPAAHYVTDAFGRLEYVNPAFEHLLGYEGGEVLENKLSIRHMLYQLHGQPVPEDYTLADYAGQAMLQKKQGLLIPVRLSQILIRDESGKALGATGSLLPQEA